MSDFTTKSAQKAAGFFGVTLKTIREWRERGCPCTVGSPGNPGNYDLQEMLEWCKSNVWVRKQNESQDAEGPSKTDLEKEKLAVEIAQKELALQEKSGKLVDRDAVYAAMRREYAIVRSRLEAIPGEVASAVPPDMRADVIADWTHKVKLALRELSEVE